MKKLVFLVLIIGFLFVDMLFFHDIFKPGETTSLAQWLTGILSIPVFIISIQSILSDNKGTQAK
jgi:hypothetical protein